MNFNILFFYNKLNINQKISIKNKGFNGGLGIGVWGLGMGVGGLGLGGGVLAPAPNPQTPNPQSPIPNPHSNNYIKT